MKFISVMATLFLSCATAFGSGNTAFHPKFSNDELLLPSDYRNWVTLSSSTPGVPHSRPKHFAGKIFVEPSAFNHFTRTGVWPDKTVIVLELRKATTKARKQPVVLGFEAAVKNNRAFPDPWSFYGIIFDRQGSHAGAKERSSSNSELLDIRLAMAFPTLRAVINAEPSTMVDGTF